VLVSVILPARNIGPAESRTVTNGNSYEDSAEIWQAMLRRQIHAQHSALLCFLCCLLFKSLLYIRVIRVIRGSLLFLISSVPLCLCAMPSVILTKEIGNTGNIWRVSAV